MQNILMITDNIENLFDMKGNFKSIRFYDDIVPELCFYVETDEKLKKELNKIKKSKIKYKYENFILEHNETFFNKKAGNFDNVSFDSMMSVLDTIDYIELNLEKVDTLEYIKNNDILSNKKIIISKTIRLTDFDKINKMLEKYKDIKENIYVYMEYDNCDCVKLEDCAKVINTIKNIVDRIKSYNFSTLETIMYVYDLIRYKKYNEENDDESLSESRNLSKIVLGDKIVCEGYVTYFMAILKQLNIDVEHDSVYDRFVGHSRATIYVKDDKYNIDGLYYFDPTRDNSIDEMGHLDNYRCFAKTKKEIDIDNKFGNFNHKDKNLPTTSKEFLKCLDKNKNTFYNKDYINWIHKLYRLTGIKDSNPNGMPDEKAVELAFSKINRPIDPTIMVNVLHNVRKVEYLENNNVPFSIEDYFYITKNANWNFADDDAENKLLCAFFGKTMEEIEAEKFYNFIESTNIGKEIKNIKNEKVLKLNNQML